MMNLSIAGTLGRDAELRQTNGGNQVLSFSVAVSGYDFKAREKTTQWVRCSIWGKRGEALERLLTQGSRVACSGELKLGSYEKNGETVTTLELTAQDVTLLGGGSSDGAGAGGGSGSGGARRPNTSRDEPGRPAPGAGDDDIPFVRWGGSGECV